MLAKTPEAKWSMAGDRCPRCGGTNTVVQEFVNPVAGGGTIPGEFYIQLAPPSYTMRCLACSHPERRSGIPGD